MAEKSPDRKPAIGMANLLPFASGARFVGDGYFRDFLSQAAELRGYLGTEFETPAFEIDLREVRTAENFVASRFVVDARAVEQIGEMSQKFCAQKKP